MKVRKYTFTFIQPFEGSDDMGTAEEDLGFIKNGDLDVNDLMFLANDKESDMHYVVSVTDEEI